MYTEARDGTGRDELITVSSFFKFGTMFNCLFRVFYQIMDPPSSSNRLKEEKEQECSHPVATVPQQGIIH